MSEQLHLVLTRHWYDEIESGRKRIEYRAMTKIEDDGTTRPLKWVKEIWGRRDQIKVVKFSRAMTKTTQTFAVDKIDIGPCPIPGWSANYIRIHFTDL